MRTVRAIAGALAIAVIAACGPGLPDDATTPTVGVTDGPVPPGGTPTTPPGGPDPDPEAGDPVERPQGDELTEGAGEAGAELTPVDDLGAVGRNGRAMLRGDRPRLVVEIDVQEGVAPSQGAVDHLIATLAQHADKPGGIALSGGNSFASDRTGWTAADLRDVAATHRSTSSGRDVVSLYVLYVRGGFVADGGAGDDDDGEETNAIGVAHRASEIAMFPDRWGGLPDVLGSSERIERAVLVHELGHTLGLVELTYDSDHDRQDPEYPGHSANRGSVMYWAVETTLVGQVFNGPPPDAFDAADVDDLTALREGR